MMYVCSNCRTGDYFEAEDLEIGVDVEPHGERTVWKECPKCLSRDHLVALDGSGLTDLRAWGRFPDCPQELRQWAVDVLYDIASEQVMV